MKFSPAFLVVLLTLASQCIGQTITFDDFDTANWFPVDTNIDLVSGEPKAWGPGIFEVTPNTVRMAATEIVPEYGGPLDSGFMAYAYAPSTADSHFANGTYRAKVRTEDEVVVSMNIRGNLADFTAYSITASARFGDVAIGRANPDGSITALASIPDAGFKPQEDWWLEASAIGDRLSLKAWQDGTVEPTEPQIVVQDDVYTTGLFSLGPAWVT